ncbi:MAG: deoxyguanosinetriphosphate triphosphohydrolase [candidate division Zixibacteria bacterium]|nr:deoxyguanosinetriphosphate triphosphohydrolase [candidate division Zixibacteria bacterium]
MENRNGIVNLREEIEENEARTLAPFAALSRDSRGRKYAESDHPFRSRYQRDRDRVVHSAAFRRLEYKTQVFVNHEGDHYRTRLTHTLEVAQISRTIARGLRLNEDLAETIALVHDLGHTPFGHAGEDALNSLMRKHANASYNHNRQSLRVVEYLERRYPDYPGLNLTFETREGIVKHETSYDAPEAEDYDPELNATLEAQIVNFSDEIAYNCHDVDDGLFSDVLQLEEIMEVPLWRDLYLQSEKQYHGLSRSKRQYHVIRQMINREVTDLIYSTAANLSDKKIGSLDDVRNCDEPIALFSPELVADNTQLKGFLMEKMYRHSRLIRMTGKAHKILTSLFETYLQNPLTLPPKYNRMTEEQETSQVVCDYIAGMTDRFAILEYKRLFDPSERV